MKRRLVIISMLSFSFVLLVFYNNCAPTNLFTSRTYNTTLGNPMKVEVGPNLNSSVTSLSLCIRQLFFYPSGGAGPFTISLNSAITSVGNVPTTLQSISIPGGSYTEVDANLSANCGANSQSLQITNAQGTFSSTDTLVAKFIGPFKGGGQTPTLLLSMQPFVDQLASVASSAQVDSVVSSTTSEALSVSSPQFVQLAKVSANANISVSGVTFSNPVSNGNYLFCVLTYNGTAQKISSLSDSGNNTYLAAIGKTQGAGGSLANWSQEIWFTPNPVQGGVNFEVLATFNGVFSGEKDIICHEYTGLSASNPLDDAQAFVGSGANLTTSPTPNSYDNEIVFGAALFESPSQGGPGFVQLTTLNNIVTENMAIGAVGEYSLNFINPNMNWIAQLLFLRGN